MSVSKNVIVIGGGVSGITTALTLQLMGFETTVLAEQLVGDDNLEDPRFASLYPAASIIPHSVYSDALDTLFPASLAIFRTLKDRNLDSLVRHRHFELFEFPVSRPGYATNLSGFTAIENLEKERIPRRPDAPALHGWAFDCYITEWPGYMHRLYSLYRQAGGKIEKRSVEKRDIPNLPAEIIVNCTGIWTSTLFEDPADHEIIRGHLVYLPNKQPIKDAQGRICSYNYTPVSDCYTTPGGDSSDVYCYPINGRWVLGGSRQKGYLAEGAWHGKQHEDTLTISGHLVPKAIIELNNEILEHTYGLNIDRSNQPMKASLGYRYTRCHNNGLRLEATETAGKKIIHNYGHGGAGVTLSWGCALNVLGLLGVDFTADFLSPDSFTEDGVLNYLQLALQRVYLNDFSSLT